MIHGNCQSFFIVLIIIEASFSEAPLSPLSLCKLSLILFNLFLFLSRNNTSYAISLGEIFPILSGTINFFALIFGQAKNLFFF